ncbi:lipocalin family protein [Flavivirga algicola]|uniref:Lipocalin-like domain-containing protein n=1 Tax=Flavivirga algicola TaxID=2729136 RepID=A0ABX1RXC8_9FLAO|nr:lipocalin family protein [Flavivirga algicola]NMH88245.1 hypothetical protein [Flavivirga algicola]
MKHIQVTLISTVIMTMLFSASGCAQEIKNELLSHKWYLHAYHIENKTYSPEKKEKEDFIQFNNNMTFISKSEGNIEKGQYTLNSKDHYIEFKDNAKGVLRAYIISVDTKTLVLKYDVRELRAIEVVYKRSR